MNTPRTGRGRPTADTNVADEALLQAWHASRTTGVSRRQFAAVRSMTPDELERVIQRATKRIVKDHGHDAD